ncbi:MAG: HNH endonuclease [Candidatus Thiodubiliella endoseptemdiera]|uniref:HNH endonuclease n=1 Tax=Candidatus Thiodubiliella endoseptemdiera TaxID=2738886 RepID=A0A853F3A8_9GAMM|nr:HNH endonuclease [Candidatus Thiodubiliella endoseptemdiera]
MFESIEHISPQANNWNGVTDERKNTLGNLTLLPTIINSSAGNRNLQEKELMFEALSAETTKEQEEYLKGSKVKFGENTKSILGQSQHFPYLKSLANLKG